MADALDLVLRASVLLFMVSSLAGVGLGLAVRDAVAPLKHWRFVALTMIASWVLCPAVAYLLLRIVPLDDGYATGLLLLALAPCAPFAPAMVQVARGDPAYMAAFILLSGIGTVAIMPVGVPLMIRGLSADPGAVARPLILFVLLPLLAGMALRTLHPRAAERASPVAATVTTAAGLAALLLTAVLHGPSVLDAVGSYAIAVQVLFVGGVTIGSYLVGAGLADDQRSVLTIGLCTRNLGAALVPLATIDRDPHALVMIAIGVPVTLGMSAIAARWLARERRIRAGFA